MLMLQLNVAWAQAVTQLSLQYPHRSAAHLEGQMQCCRYHRLLHGWVRVWPPAALCQVLQQLPHDTQRPRACSCSGWWERRRVRMWLGALRQLLAC
jgi:hypothetical protein